MTTFIVGVIALVVGALIGYGWGYSNGQSDGKLISTAKKVTPDVKLKVATAKVVVAKKAPAKTVKKAKATKRTKSR